MRCWVRKEIASLTCHQALTFNRDLDVLGLERGDDDGAGVPVVVVVQYGGLCVVAVVVGGSGLHSVRAVAGAVRVGGVVDRHAADDILPLL